MISIYMDGFTYKPQKLQHLHNLVLVIKFSPEVFSKQRKTPGNCFHILINLQHFAYLVEEESEQNLVDTTLSSHNIQYHSITLDNCDEVSQSLQGDSSTTGE